MPKTKRRATPSLTIPPGAWEPVGPEDDKRAHLHASVTICGTFFHADAIAVRMVPDTSEPVESIPIVHEIQQATHPELREYLEGFLCAAEPDGTLETVAIAGRDYAVFLYPHN